MEYKNLLILKFLSPLTPDKSLAYNTRIVLLLSFRSGRT